MAAPLNVGDNAVRATIADTLTTPAESPTVTIMLDQSMPADEGGQTAPGQRRRRAQGPICRCFPADSGVGLWTFDGVAGRSEVAVGPLSDRSTGDRGPTR